MEGYVAPLLILVVLFVGFGLTHRNGTKGSRGCSGCEEDCADKTECDSHNLRA
ncbi:MAG: hypothetical protein PVF46_03880 [Lysobacterales bacterium]|jgi:hypothetical protein